MKPEIIDTSELYRNLWDKYLDNVDKLNEKERELFCKFMESVSEPFLYIEKDGI